MAELSISKRVSVGLDEFDIDDIIGYIKSFGYDVTDTLHDERKRKKLYRTTIAPETDVDVDLDIDYDEFDEDALVDVVENLGYSCIPNAQNADEADLNDRSPMLTIEGKADAFHEMMARKFLDEEPRFMRRLLIDITRCTAHADNNTIIERLKNII